MSRYPREIGTAEECAARAEDSAKKYKVKRDLISFLERLDCVAEAAFIAEIATIVIRKRIAK